LRVINLAYVYEIEVDGIVRYVGKGSGKRVDAYFLMVRSILRRRAAGEIVRTTKFYNRLAKAYRNGSDIQVDIVIDGLSDDEAFEFEIEHISSFKLGQLWNMTLGGDAPPSAKGRKLSDETIKKITSSNKKRWSDSELRLQQSDAKKVHWLRPEYRDIFSKAASHSSKAKSDAAKKRWADLDYRSRNIAQQSTLLERKRRSDLLKEKWADPIWRSNMLAARKKEY